MIPHRPPSRLPGPPVQALRPLPGRLPCRPGCAACCIAPSISTPLPGLPGGKPAGQPCPHLGEALRCRLFGRPERPAVCASLAPSAEMCGRDRVDALATLAALEAQTRPDAAPTGGHPRAVARPQAGAPSGPAPGPHGR